MTRLIRQFLFKLTFFLASTMPLINSCTTLPTTIDVVSIPAKLERFEISSGGRIGVSAINTANGKQLQYRADENFPLCSTSKVMIVAAMLKVSMKDNALLQKRITYSKKDVMEAGYAPTTEKNLATGMSLADLNAATIQYSDNAAANLLMKELGGPEAITAFARKIGDSSFRLDRWEPELNSAYPGDLRDTATPASMERSLRILLLGDTLASAQRKQFQDLLKGNTTGDARIRSGVPKGWIVGDKTGTCLYGTTNDVGIIWPPNKAPIVVAIYFTQNEKEAARRDDIVSSVTKIIVDEIE